MNASQGPSRIQTGIAGLDEILNRGLPRGKSVIYVTFLGGPKRACTIHTRFWLEWDCFV
jgi:KaiC/GvpD/RAD55 family RecA-like ATPase